MTVLSNPDPKKTRELREAVARYQEHIGNRRGADLVRAQPDTFSEWSPYAHAIVHSMDKAILRGDLPAGVDGMLSYSAEKTAELLDSKKAEAELNTSAGADRNKWGGKRQSRNVEDRRGWGRDPETPTIYGPEPSVMGDILDRGQRGFEKIVAALIGDGSIDTPEPRSREDAARLIRTRYGSEVWGAPSPMTVDKHAWDAGGKPSFGGDWYNRGERLMRDAWLEANRKDQSTVSGDMGADPPGMPNGFPMSMNERDLDGDGIDDFAGSFAAGGRGGRRSKIGGAVRKATQGSIVTTPVDGVFVGYHPDFRSYGGVAFVKGDDGSYTVISGLEASNVQPGDRVSAGDPIGIVGNKGIGVQQKNPDGSWNQDTNSLLDGVQMAGTDPVPGYDGGAMADAGTASDSPSSGLMGIPSSSTDYADAGLRGAPVMPGVAPPADYADAGLRGALNPAQAAIAKALMRQQAPALTQAELDAIGQIEVTPVSQAEFEAATAPAIDRSFTSENLGAPSGYGFDAQVGKTTRYSPASFPSDMTTAYNSFGAFGPEVDVGVPNVSLADVGPMTNFTRDVPAAPTSPNLGAPTSDMASTALNSFGVFGPEAQGGVFGSPSEVAVAGPGVAAGDSVGTAMGLGSFGGIGTPTADQAASFERGFQPSAQRNPGLSAAALSGTPANSIVGPTQKADVYAPGLRDFKNAFESSVKTLGPNYSKAIAAALATPSLDNQMAAVEATRAYSNMNGRPSKAVTALRNQQIGDFAMANPALSNALGLSMGQQGQSGLNGGFGADVFGHDPFGGGHSTPGNGPTGNGSGQPSGVPGPMGPNGPAAGHGYSGAGNPGATPGGSQHSSPSTGNNSSAGNPAGSPSPGGVIAGRGPSANPSSGGGLSASAVAAIGAALAGKAEADAAASSDAARGFGYGGFGPSFSGGFF